MEREQQGGDREGGGRFFQRRRPCRFCIDSGSIDFKDVGLLRNFLTERGRIVAAYLRQLHEAPARADGCGQTGPAHRSHQFCGRAIIGHIGDGNAGRCRDGISQAAAG